MTQRSRPTGHRSATWWRLPAAVALLSALVAVVLAAGGSGGNDGNGGNDDGTPAGVDGTEAESVEGPPIRGAGPMAVGEDDAPVVMVMYSEFQCPFCGKFARDTEPQLVDRFVDDGTLRIEWRDLPYLGQESVVAAAAGRAAADQGAFWPFAARLYADQAPPNSGRLNADFLTGVATELGLDTERFRQVMESQSTLEAVQADVDEAVSLGVTGTPAFFVNGELIIGAQPTEVFVDAIERAAASAP